MNNILYITNFHPSRKDLGGGGVRTYLLWKALQSVGDVYVVTPGEKTARVDDHWYTYHAQHRYIGNVFEGRLWRYTGKYGNLVTNPCYTPMHLSDWFPKVKFNLAIGRYFNAFNQIRPWKNTIPTYVDVDDHPLELMTKYDRSVSWMSKMVMSLSLGYLEMHMQGGWIAKESDIKFIHRKRNFELLQNIPLEYGNVPTRDNEERQLAVMTVGLFSYEPNVNGVNDFLINIWSHLIKIYPKMQYWIVGGGLSHDSMEKWSSIPGVKVWGYIEDLDNLYEKCLATIIPINRGAGSCIKTIESLSRGRIAISTECGARGLEQCISNIHENVQVYNPILCYKNLEQFIYCIDSIILNTQKRRILEEKAYSFARQNFSFDKFREIVVKKISKYIN